MAKKICVNCGEDIVLSKEDIFAIEEGYCLESDINLCDECADANNFDAYEPDTFSDADPGL